MCRDCDRSNWNADASQKHKTMVTGKRLNVSPRQMENFSKIELVIKHEAHKTKWISISQLNKMEFLLSSQKPQPLTR